MRSRGRQILIDAGKIHWDDRVIYDNLLYMVAGQIVSAVTGQSWEDFITDHIFTELQMQSCAANLTRKSRA